MNPEWNEFLQEHGAQFNADDQITSFSNPELEVQLSSQKGLLSNPSDRGLLKVSGEDAESFLQNQLTNDIRDVNDTNHQASAWCSPKGRIIVNFRIFKRGDDFYLSLASDLIEHVIKKLRMYVMMSKVVIEDLSDSMVHFSFSGKDAQKQMEGFLGDSISNDVQVFQHQSLNILKLSDVEDRESNTYQRFDIYGDIDGAVEDAKLLWLECEKTASVVSGSGSRYLNIVAGEPEISQASSEAWIPQMVNYIHINGVDFKKGCYPGQEVVARLNYLGKTKRRMYRIQISGSDLAGIGAVIKSESDAEAGKVLNSVASIDASANPCVEALAVLKIASTKESLSLADNDEATITLLDLPYTVDDE